MKQFINFGEASFQDHSEIENWISNDWRGNCAGYHVLMVWHDSETWSESAWMLIRRQYDNSLFEVHGSHCSCHGFEDQWEPESTNIQYLLSDQFTVSGADDKQQLDIVNALRKLFGWPKLGDKV